MGDHLNNFGLASYNHYKKRKQQQLYIVEPLRGLFTSTGLLGSTAHLYLSSKLCSKAAGDGRFVSNQAPTRLLHALNNIDRKKPECFKLSFEETLTF